MELNEITGASAAANTAVGTRERVGDDVFFGLLGAYAAENGDKAKAAAPTQTVSLEEMLRAKYPNLMYHVFDASSSYWRTRNDFPHYLLYQKDSERAAAAIENFTPSGANPFYGSVDGRFIAPKEIRALASVPPGSRAVVIHPKVQARMEEEPEYALEIMARIEAWWAFDVARNEAMMPGITARSSWSIAIGEDGEIANAQSHSQGEITTSSKSAKEDDEKSFWELRLERHAYFMELITEKQLDHAAAVSDRFRALNVQNAAKAKLAEMLGDEGLAAILGETIADVPTEQVLLDTAAIVFGVNLPKAKK
ncbi:MAG: hypothetical protein NC084_09105 [Bacteroides sp.]|nr:hypothetical protein [Eubacterium sp.]MCM1419025.1 hypothetical protein [Roseburia sp.]MCM1462853.1 hypothetical protein [Bacteroides sp.]